MSNFDPSDYKNELIKTVSALNNQLKVEIWSEDFDHALDGHPEVTLEKIERALNDPLKVVKSKKSSVACLFYNFEVHDPHFGKIYFCVVVRVIGEGKGKVETAYETLKIKEGQLLYSKEDKS